MEYKMVQEDRFDDIIMHLRNSFFADEPLNKAALLPPGNPDLEHHSYETLCDNLSLMAVTENNEIAGVVLNGVLKRGDIEKSKESLKLTNDESFKKIFTLLYTQNLRINLFEKFNVEKIFDIRILSVDPKFRGKGIASELVKRSELLAKSLNFKIMKADATGIFSQKILKSYQFITISELYYDKYLDECGKIILPVASPHSKLEILCKIIE